MTISRHPGSCAEPRPLLAVSPTRDEAFRPTHLPTVSPADPCSELGPRSLDPDRCFCSAFAELIRDLSSPTDFCNCLRRAGNQTRALHDPRRDGDLDLLPFLDVSRPLPCGSGDTRRAALRPVPKTPVLVPPAFTGLPSRDASVAAPPPKLAPAEHSEDRRARVRGPSEGRVPGRMRRSLVPASGAYA
jgi:hypothetical protein